MPTLAENKRKLAELCAKQHERYTKSRVSGISDGERLSLVEEFNGAEPELKSLRESIAAEEQMDAAARKSLEDLERLREIDPTLPYSVQDAAATNPGYRRESGFAAKSIGQMIVESEAFKVFAREAQGNSCLKSVAMPNIGNVLDCYNETQAQHILREAAAIKAATSSGLTSYERVPGQVFQGVELPTIISLIPQGTTSMTTVRSVRETAFTPAAAAVAEDGILPDAAWDKAEVDDPVRDIGVAFDCSQNLLEDYEATQQWIDQRLPLMVGIEEEVQVLGGNGTTPNLRGILSTSGILLHTQGYDVDETTAVSGDTMPDAILRAMTRIAHESHFQPTAVAMNPFDFMKIRLMRTGTGDAAGGANRGPYLFGSPSEVGMQTLWGFQVPTLARLAQGTAIGGAWNLGAMLWRRRGLTVEMTNAHDNNFKKRIVTFRAYQRQAFSRFRPQAFCKITLTG